MTSISQKAKISDQWRERKAAEKEWQLIYDNVKPDQAYSNVFVEIHPSDDNPAIGPYAGLEACEENLVLNDCEETGHHQKEQLS